MVNTERVRQLDEMIVASPLQLKYSILLCCVLCCSVLCYVMPCCAILCVQVNFIKVTKSQTDSHAHTDTYKYIKETLYYCICPNGLKLWLLSLSEYTFTEKKQQFTTKTKLSLSQLSSLWLNHCSRPSRHGGFFLSFVVSKPCDSLNDFIDFQLKLWRQIQGTRYFWGMFGT